MDSSIPASAWDLDMDDIDREMLLTTSPEGALRNSTAAHASSHRHELQTAGPSGDFKFGSALPCTQDVTNNLSPAYSLYEMAKDDNNAHLGDIRPVYTNELQP